MIQTAPLLGLTVWLELFQGFRGLDFAELPQPPTISHSSCLSASRYTTEFYRAQ